MNKYDLCGAYHWAAAYPAELRSYNPIVAARYERALTFAVNSTGRLLDVGCGDCFMAYRLSQMGRVVSGIDVSLSAMLAGKGESQKRMPCRNDRPPMLIQAASDKMPLRSGAFSVVLCMEVIEHVVEPMLMLQEMRRVMCDDGCVYLTTPLRNARGMRDRYHVREYDVEEFGSLLSAVYSSVDIKIYGMSAVARMHKKYSGGRWWQSLVATLARAGVSIGKYPVVRHNKWGNIIEAVCRK